MNAETSRSSRQPVGAAFTAGEIVASFTWILFFVCLYTETFLRNTSSTRDLFFYALPVLAGSAVAIAAIGFAIQRRFGVHSIASGIGVALYAAGFGLVTIASYTWFSIPSCAGGYSGPCMTPLLFTWYGIPATSGAVVASAFGAWRSRKLRLA